MEGIGVANGLIGGHGTTFFHNIPWNKYFFPQILHLGSGMNIFSTRLE